jgi:hypothetical protein
MRGGVIAFFCPVRAPFRSGLRRPDCKNDGRAPVRSPAASPYQDYERDEIGVKKSPDRLRPSEANRRRWHLVRRYSSTHSLTLAFRITATAFVAAYSGFWSG